MKRLKNKLTKSFDSIQETDIDESCYASSKSHASAQKKLKQKRKRENSQILKSRHHLKLFRFRLNHSRKTLRIYCFNEQDLHLPVRFTRKLNKHQMDNDVETDEELAEYEVERCVGMLQQAIKENEASEE